jgi:hypothetical protein
MPFVERFRAGIKQLGTIPLASLGERLIRIYGGSVSVFAGIKNFTVGEDSATGTVRAFNKFARTFAVWRKRAARTKGYPAFRSSEPPVAGCEIMCVPHKHLDTAPDGI